MLRKINAVKKLNFLFQIVFYLTQNVAQSLIFKKKLVFKTLCDLVVLFL